MRLIGLYIILLTNLGHLSPAMANFGQMDDVDIIDIEGDVNTPAEKVKPIVTGSLPRGIEISDVTDDDILHVSNEQNTYSSNFKDQFGYSPKDQKLNSTYEKLVKSGDINPVALHNTFKFYEKNKNTKGLSSKYLAVVDYTKPSSQGRYFWINLQTGKIEHALKVAHGSGSGIGPIPAKCSSKPGSNSTPCGFHKYGDPYISGKNGISIKMHGLQPINSSTEKRHVVAHAARYVKGSQGLGKSSYNSIRNSSGILIKAVINADINKFYNALPSSFRDTNKVTTAKANTSPIGESWGCHAFGGEDYAKVVPHMKDVLSYNYFGEGTEGPTKTTFYRPKGENSRYANNGRNNNAG